MLRRIKIVAALFLVSAFFICATASLGRAQAFLQRLSAQFLKFDDGELHAGPADTVGADNGVSIYTEHVSAGASVNVLYVTLSATGDVNGTDVAGYFTCLVDSGFCNGGETAATGVPGWISLQAGTNTEHDNAINYTWCTPVAPKKHVKGKARFDHTVELRMASNGNGTSFIEGMHVFIDANQVKDPSKACAQAH